MDLNVFSAKFDDSFQFFRYLMIKTINNLDDNDGQIGSRSSVYSPESKVRKIGSYIYEDFIPTDGADVKVRMIRVLNWFFNWLDLLFYFLLKVYTVGPDYAHAEARKSPALDGKVERDHEGKEIRYPVILSNLEKLIARKVCLAFNQTVYLRFWNHLTPFNRIWFDLKTFK